MLKFLTAISVLLFILVSVGWYCSEDIGGHLGRRAVDIGCFIVSPGCLADAILTGSSSVHTRFGDWRDPLFEILFSFLAYMLPFIVIAICASFDRKEQIAPPPTKGSVKQS